MSITRAHFVRTDGVPKLLRSVVGEVCEGRRGGELSWHRRGRYLSTAAMVSDDADKVQRSGKRISKRERRTMVEAFVNTYRTLNAGKFPSASVTKKEVGGSYYVIREILQEVKFDFVHNPVGEIPVNPLVEKSVENEIMPGEAEEGSCSQSSVDPQKERHSSEAERVPCTIEDVSTTGMQVLADEVETEVVRTVNAEVGRGSTAADEVRGHPTSRDLTGRTGDISTNQKLTCEENERGSFDEHANHCVGREKYPKNKKKVKMAGSSEKTLLEDASRPKSKEDKDGLIKTSSFLRPDDNSVPYTEKPPVLADEKSVKSTSKPIENKRKGVTSASKPIDNPRKDVKSASKPIDDPRKDVKSPSKPIDDQRSSAFDESRKSSTETAGCSDPQQKPSLWRNLKSFADSIFSIWKKN